jgi:predicted DNA-binding ribbon-helix-helix protein
MASVRRTISLPPNLADQLDKEAERRGMTFSALIADLAGAETAELPYAGIITDDEDLSLRVEEVLSRLAS